MSHSDDIPVVTPYAPRVEKTPAAVREALDPDWRAEFEAGWRAALDQAKETFDLDPAHEVVIRWWPRAQLCQVPGAREEKERVEREFLAGRYRGIPWEPEFDDITEEEIRAADGRITL
ncbi:hypothetical protein C3Y87_01890 [Carbonactinospora thermoautotrophica]|uniref:DUF6247 family protein n=1 Tax=Carbonactinospora thermoautotrophica TaxID=1469144 RepID=UPI002270F2BE|nr:DUF6247 family protein [Carbonactinospora thermoautotrophica]MCX9190182.1 hypothetical protein [Carbonactinospora thermoautotrophica]